LTRQPTQARYTRLSNVPGGVKVSMEFKTTFATTEVRTFPVPFIGMSTVRTLLRSVSGIYKEDMFSNSFGLVPDKLLKLIERPAIELLVKLFASAFLDSDLAQIFKSKYSVFRVHNLLGYTVIGISREPSFLTCHSLKLAFGRFGAFGLQLLSEMGILSTPILDPLGVEELIIRADSNIHYSTIYSKNSEVCDLLRIVMLKRYMQIENLVSAVIRDCRGLDSPAKITAISRRYKESGLEPSLSACNSSNPMHKVHGNNSLIISYCRERLSFWKRFTFYCLQSFTSTIPSSLHQRGRKIGDAFTSKLVGRVMVIDLIPRLVLESPFCRDGKCFGISSHRIEESPTILVSQTELECNRSKHIHIVGG
jgi:hypothetical protein